MLTGEKSEMVGYLLQVEVADDQWETLDVEIKSSDQALEEAAKAIFILGEKRPVRMLRQVLSTLDINREYLQGCSQARPQVRRIIQKAKQRARENVAEKKPTKFKFIQIVPCHKQRIGECQRDSGNATIICDDQGFYWCGQHFPADRMTNTGIKPEEVFQEEWRAF